MKKRLFLMLALTVCIFTLFSNNKVLAYEVDEEVVMSKQKLSEDLIVEIFRDGRVAPIKNSDELSEEKLDLILKRIGYSDDAIINWNINRKRELVNYGGKVVKGNVSELKHEYVSSDGKTYEITPFNRNKIKDIQIEDLKQAGISGDKIEKMNIIEEDKSLMSINNGFIQDGKWSAQTSMVHVGQTVKQRKYVVTTDYFWKEQPISALGGSLGMHWGSNGTPVENSARAAHAINYLGTWHSVRQQINASNSFGITSKFSHPDHISGQQTGFLSEEIWVSKDLKGHIIGVSGAYTHPWVGGNWSLSIGSSGLSFSMPDVMANNWSWRYSYIVD